ncbi:MAG: FGGY family carbohydrate kinase, partial [Actinomycetota bacterium]
MSFILGLDAGTSGAGAVICDADGRLMASAKRPWSYQPDADGFPSIDPQAILGSLGAASQEVLRAAAVAPGDITAVGITSQRTGVVFTDAAGEVLHAGPNADPRGMQHGIAIEREHGDDIYRTTGRLPVFLYLPARLAWLRANKPQVASRIAHAFSFADWVCFALTGRAATDRTQAAEMLCYSLADGGWSAELCRALDVPQAILPDIAEGQPCGEVLPAAATGFGLAAGTPVVPCGADSQCAAASMGAIDAGDVIVPAGTTMPVQQVVPKLVIDEQRRLWCSPHVMPDRFVIEAHCSEAGPAIDWLLGILDRDYAWLDQAAAVAPPGAGGIVHVDTGPTAMGDYPMVRTGGYSYPIPVMVLGRTREDLARASLEGVAFAARAAVEWLTSVSGADAARVMVTGGLAQSRTFASILACVLGRPVRRAGLGQSSALGACIVAAAASGLHPSMAGAVAAMHDPGEEVPPEPGAPAVYDALYPG